MQAYTTRRSHAEGDAAAQRRRLQANLIHLMGQLPPAAPNPDDSPMLPPNAIPSAIPGAPSPVVDSSSPPSKRLPRSLDLAQPPQTSPPIGVSPVLDPSPLAEQASDNTPPCEAPGSSLRDGFSGCEDGDTFVIPDDWEDENAAPDHAAPPVVCPDAGEAPALQPSISNQREPPKALFVPQHKLAENTPDPFYNPSVDDSIAVRPPSPSEIHPEQGVFLLYMVVSWLHLQYHLPFRACSVLVQVILLIIKAFGATVSRPAPLTTLPSIFARLDVEPRFKILPVCPTCKEVYPQSIETPLLCRHCSSPIFKFPAKRTPHLQAPYMSIQTQITTLLGVPGVEAMLDEWRDKPRSPNRYTDIFDGEVTRTIQAPDGSPFFRNGFEDGPNGELRIGLTLGLDW